MAPGLVRLIGQWRGTCAAAAVALLAASSPSCAGAETAPVRPTAEEARAARLAKQAEWLKAAQSRTNVAVRGLQLGMTLPELERTLGTEVVEVRPERKPGWKAPAFYPYEETLRLADGSKLTVTFSSPVSGSLGGVIMSEQTLRDGPSPEKLFADLTARYGAPDERGASGWWLTWHLRSRASSPDGLGSFLKIHFRSGADGKVEYFRVVLNDYKFMLQDEQNAVEARRAAERREYERQKSDTVKF